MKNPDPLERFAHIGKDVVGTEGCEPSETNTTILAGDYRGAPGADTFWKQNYGYPNPEAEA